MKPHAVYIRHFPNLRLTLALQIGPDGKSAVLAAAKAGPKDQWSKSRGRLIAIGRLASEKPSVRGRYPAPAPEHFTEHGNIIWSKFLSKFISNGGIGLGVFTDEERQDNLFDAIVEAYNVARAHGEP